jgi:hypothetical protein
MRLLRVIADYRRTDYVTNHTVIQQLLVNKFNIIDSKSYSRNRPWRPVRF